MSFQINTRPMGRIAFVCSPSNAERKANAWRFRDSAVRLENMKKRAGRSVSRMQGIGRDGPGPDTPRTTETSTYRTRGAGDLVIHADGSRKSFWTFKAQRCLNSMISLELAGGAFDVAAKF